MSAYKEIVTKAVVGKGKKYYKNTYKVNTDSPVDTVLGCWVINHKFSGSDEAGKIVINGSYDVNLWYSYDNNTKTSVITKNIPYKELVTVSQKETTDTSKKDIIVRCLKGPSCISAKEDGNSINIDIEKELGIEIVGDTKVKIAIEEDEEPWDDIPEEVTECLRNLCYINMEWVEEHDFAFDELDIDAETKELSIYRFFNNIMENLTEDDILNAQINLESKKRKK